MKRTHFLIALTTTGFFATTASVSAQSSIANHAHGIQLPLLAPENPTREIRNHLATSGLTPPGIPNEKKADAAIEDFFLKIDTLSTERNQVIEALRTHTIHHALGHALLHDLFGGDEGTLPPDFDKGYLVERAAANDMESIASWESFRDLLLAKELPLFPPGKIGGGKFKGPEAFSGAYQVYRESVDWFRTPLKVYDNALAGKVSQLQQQASEFFFASYSDRITSLPKDRFQTLQKVKSALESVDTRNAIVSILTRPARGSDFSAVPVKEDTRKPAEMTQSIPPTPVEPDEKKAPTANSAFPPTLPDTPCRIVTLMLDDSASVPASVTAAGYRDYTDVVRLGEVIRTKNLVALRKGGQPVFWSDEGVEYSPAVEVPAVATFFNYGRVNTFFTWLDEKGKLHTPDRPIRPELPSLHHVNRIHGLFFAIDENGQRHLWGLLENHGRIDPIRENLPEILEITGLTTLYTSLTMTGGRAARVVEGNFGDFFDEGDTVTPVSRTFVEGLALDEDGRFIMLDRRRDLISVLQEEVTFPVSRLTSADNVVAVSGPEGTPPVILSRKSGNEAWSRNEAAEAALRHAVDTHVVPKRIIHALIPADKIPRSGAWTLTQFAELNP